MNQQLAVSPGELRFDTTFVGYARELGLELANLGRGERRLMVQLEPGPFHAPETLTLGPGEQRMLMLRFAPTQAGTASARLVLSSGEEVHTVSLTGRAQLPPVCTASGPCRQARLDVASGTCVEDALPDGVACQEPCLLEGQCRSGTCVGRSITCDDGDACTADACGPTGCLHLPVTLPEPGPENACQAAVCDARAGILWVDVPDGTACGKTSCSEQRICMVGACVAAMLPADACGVGVDPDAPDAACTIETYRPDGTLAERDGWAPGPLPLDTARIHDSLQYSWAVEWVPDGQPLANERFAPSGVRQRYVRYGYEGGLEVLRLFRREYGQRRLEWRYDGGKLELRREEPTDLPVEEDHFRYALDGRLERVDIFSGGVLASLRVPFYDVQGLLERVERQRLDGSTWGTETYERHPNGEVARVEYNSNRYYFRTGWTATYDTQGHLTSVDGNATDESSFHYGFTYDGAGRLTQESRGFSSSFMAHDSSVAYVYDALGRLDREVSRQKESTYGSGTVRVDETQRSRTFLYAEDGRLLEVLEDTDLDGAPDGRLMLSYDAAGRPVSEEAAGSMLTPGLARREFSGTCSPPSPLPPRPRWVGF